MLLFNLFLSISIASPQNSIDEAKRSLLRGDHQTAISLLEQLFKQRKIGGSQKDTARYIMASAYERRGDYLLAADQYRLVYWGGRSLSKQALYKQAVNRYQGDDHKGAISSCHKFRQKWPKNAFSSDCLLIMGSSNGHLGKLDNLNYYYQQFLEENPDSPKAESLWAQAAIFSYQNGLSGAKEQIRHYYLNHSYPTTAKQMEAILSAEELAPQNLDEKGAQIWSLIRSGFLEEAWTKTEVLKEESLNSPETKEWLDINLDSITWMTRNYDEYIERKMLAYEEEPSGTLAWKIFRGYSRAGKWEEATAWGSKMLQTYKRRGRWAGAKDDVARAYMFQRQYTKAAALWSTLRSKLAKFNYAFCLYMNGDYEEAIPLFEKLSNRKDGWGVASNYWIGRSKEKLVQDPKENYDFVVEHDETKWYTLLLMQREMLDVDSIALHNGQWTGIVPHEPVLQPLQRSVHFPSQPEPQTQKDLHLPNNIRWADFSLTESQSNSQPEVEQIGFIQPKWESFIGTLPDSYKTDLLGAEEELDEAFEKFYLQHQKNFPELKEIYYLAKAGDYPIAAHKLNAIYDLWNQAQSAVSPNDKEKKLLSLVQVPFEWLNYMLFVRSHHHVMRYTFELEKHMETEEQRRLSKQLNYPIVYPTHLWKIAQKYNLDPLLMHSILRAESTYREFIVSWAGAIGYVQVMPKTGAKVAHLLNEQSYSPKDLENPKVNLRYGSFYFSKLMERFDQAYPFAVGSYNGGPHNMSRWYKNLKGSIEMDEFVEHIPYNETRLYIKKVCGYYAQYVELYAGKETGVYIPSPPEEDDPSVIDF